ncbi:LPXTG cell wall anchor domain-containing protein, partial [Microbacterium suaedae]|uniref:LPXTG cell wall anchor domain-containing protein n=1 Tax=Microbacterium suaedae TaxID=2067813 RepID=UPI0013A60684
ADASSDASTDVSSEANASAQVAAQAAAQADATSASNADATSAAEGNASAAAAAASNADSSSDASAEAAANANASSAADGQQISMELQHERRQVGEQQVAYGYGFEPGETVTATQFSDPYAIGEQVADSNGEVVFMWDVPADSENGDHVVELTGATSGSVEATFEVYGSGGDLAATGGDTAATIGALAAAMLLVGAGAWYLLRRRELA